MKVTGVELRTIKAPLVSPFRTSFGTETVRESLLVRVVTDEAEGWGECGAGTAPLYSSQYTHAAQDVLSRFLAPALAGVTDLDAHRVAPALTAFKGHRTAKAALETAVLDADLRARGVPLAHALGAVRDRVPCGVSVGITESIPALLDAVAGYLDAGCPAYITPTRSACRAITPMSWVIRIIDIPSRDLRCASFRSHEGNLLPCTALSRRTRACPVRSAAGAVRSPPGPRRCRAPATPAVAARR
ncbi:hypothetical protein [Streptomyces sp. BE308]|uniref:hypothetical protein n=1 Tax=Streptomyces sp. BE308 TaxID=3002529 RepID=UPI002E7A5D54|nr:hypothetical protein [Streptomyces sp. BE308]